MQLVLKYTCSVKQKLVKTFLNYNKNYKKISFSRQFYNDSVTMYNTKLEVFPSNIIASIFNSKAKDFFKIENEEARKNVKVDFYK